MQDPTRKVELFAVSASQKLGERWEELKEDRRSAYRALSFGIYEGSLRVRRASQEDMIDVLSDLLTSPDTPKSWAPGLKHAINTLIAVIEEEQDLSEIRARIPTGVADELTAPDPYLNMQAGEMDPYAPTEDFCGYVHPQGFCCTRPSHPPNWKHWDADRDIDIDVHKLGSIHVTWYGDSEDFESIAPSFVADEE